MTRLLLALLLAAPVAGASPITLAQSGYLLGADDVAVTSASIPMTFAIFDGPGAGAGLVWQSDACPVAVSGGYYAVTLGAACNGTPPLDTSHLPPSASRWIAVTVSGVTLAPRLEIFSAASALVAARSLDLDAFKLALASPSGAVNSGGAVHWRQLVGVPAAFADESDDGATYSAAAGGGLAIDASRAISISPGGVTNAMLKASALTVTTSGGLTGGGTIALGGTLNLGLSGATGDATSIKGVTVNDAAKADGFVLRYDAASNRVVYANPTGAAPANPAPPATISWAADTESGNSKCAAVKGVCTSAWDGSNNPISCGAAVGAGSAACTSTAAVNESVTWASDSESGDSLCASRIATCVQAYNDLGAPFSCSTSLGSGVATCLSAPATQGFDLYATWSGSVAFNGDAQCAGKGGVCVTAWDSTGITTACATPNTSGRARCRTATTATDGWNLGIRWDPVNGSGTSGDMECAKQDAVCQTQWCTTNGLQYACNSNFTSCGGLARCRRKTASDPWTSLITWAPNMNTTGRIECSKRDQECVTQFCTTNGQEYGCDTWFTSCGGVARCRDRNATDAWTSHVEWAPGGNTTGDLECAKAGKVCTSQYCTTAGTPHTCDTMYTTCGGVARCRAPAANEPNYSVFTWAANSNTTGRMECAKRGLECVNQICVSGSTQYGCDTYFTTCSGEARCRPTTPSDQWSWSVQWPPGSNTSARVECSKTLGEAVDVYCTTDGGIRANDTQFSTCGGVARCRALTPADGWDTLATFPAGSNKTPRIACTELDAECVTSYCGTDSQTRPCDTVFGSCPGVVRCRKKVATDTWNKAIKWLGQDATGDAKCATLGGTCVETYQLSDGTPRACTASFGTATSGGIARCRI